MAALASPAELSVWLQREVDQASAAQALNAASAAIRGACGWSITEETVTGLVVDGYRCEVFLPTRRLTAVSAVTDYETVLAPSAYEWASHGRLRKASGTWGKTVTVSFTHGYAAVPDAVRAACLSVAARAVENPQGLRSWRLGDESETYASTAVDLGPQVTLVESALLGPYMIPGV